MALVTRRFVFHGPPTKTLVDEIGPSVSVPALPYVLAVDVQWDDAVAVAATVDELMRSLGYAPELIATTTIALAPYVGLVSPLGDVWALAVDNLGNLTTQKVN